MYHVPVCQSHWSWNLVTKVIIIWLYLPSVCSGMPTFLRFTCVFYLQGSDPRHASADQDQSSMLKVICNQRDRFRARLRETEEVYIWWICRNWQCHLTVSSEIGCLVLRQIYTMAFLIIEESWEHSMFYTIGDRCTGLIFGVIFIRVKMRWHGDLPRSYSLPLALSH